MFNQTKTSSGYEKFVDKSWGKVLTSEGLEGACTPPAGLGLPAAATGGASCTSSDGGIPFRRYSTARSALLKLARRAATTWKVIKNRLDWKNNPKLQHKPHLTQNYSEH